MWSWIMLCCNIRICWLFVFGYYCCCWFCFYKHLFKWFSSQHKSLILQCIRFFFAIWITHFTRYAYTFLIGWYDEERTNLATIWSTIEIMHESFEEGKKNVERNGKSLVFIRLSQIILLFLEIEWSSLFFFLLFAHMHIRIKVISQRNGREKCWIRKCNIKDKRHAW